MNNKDLLDLILSIIREHRLTAYEIAKKTDAISSFAIHKIITGESKKPRRETMLSIANALERLVVGVDLPSDVVRESSDHYGKPIITADTGVPYYDIELGGTLIKNFAEATPYIRFFVDYEPMNDCTAFLPYSGDSMLPRFKAGDSLGVREIKNLDVLLWGEPHLVITNDRANNYKTVKNIYPDKDDSKKVILRASNPEFEGDTRVNKDDIVFLGIVKGKVELTQL